MARKLRLDRLLVLRQLVLTRSKAAAMIMAGEVRVNDRLVDKPGAMFTSDACIRLKAKPRYVGRGGLKLEAALQNFAIDPTGMTCADVGASTGGFTDCLLQHGAAKVFAIDVGSGIIAYRLRVDERVYMLEKTNARYLKSLPEPVALIVIDVSFISLRHILPAVNNWIDIGASIVALVKPQFEAGKSDVGKGGIVRDRTVHRRVLRNTIATAATLNFAPVAIMRSPITGAKGNEEYLLWLRQDPEADSPLDFDDEVDALFAATA